MPLPSVLFWERKDVPGAEHALLDARDGLYAHGTVLAAAPVPFTCRYEARTGPDGATVRVDVRAEGAGWARGVRLELASGRWRVTASEQGDLDAALVATGHASAGLPGCADPDLLFGAFDVDLGGSPLFNSLPIRRLGLESATDGVSHRLSVAFVLVPSLEVVQADQIYTPLGDNRVRFASETFSADLTCDGDGFVVDYPGLARRVTAAS
ncbi:putative glycolipid-binding domain-containing protein [Actinoplanes sp. NEAU-A12]|uniref:Glycolipid-binding domain-containing protein n=1 Tax=Actinoplanes sandaracinus TaxID=3045177 RepID=A0ABT6WLQ4_9ACTN|nr:putative glycolipid-binding domain-containing protein [Actinoplanes sandaracinus]MDI6100664.1 putative glycolipid-binding domain-containing protein [Actinoplanes sandaracinus]